MQENQSIENEGTDRIHISLQDVAPDEDGPIELREDSPENIVQDLEQAGERKIKDKKKNLLESPSKKKNQSESPSKKKNNHDLPSKRKVKIPEEAILQRGESKEGPSSINFDINDKYTEQEQPKKRIRMIEYIEESFKLTKKEPKPLPPIPKKQLAVAFTLMLVGLICILVGSINALNAKDSSKGIALWTIGALAGLPGIFYAGKFCRACYANTAESRRKALEDLPQD